jgi:thiol-disulfide isomerase/thioredoxin
MFSSSKGAAFLLAAFLWMAGTSHAGDNKLVGTQAKEWELTDWINSKARTLKEQRGKVVLVRWWTGDGCPFCAATAPALKEFHSRYSPRGLVVVGVYHHKGRGPLKAGTVKRWVRDFGFKFPWPLTRSGGP